MRPTLFSLVGLLVITALLPGAPVQGAVTFKRGVVTLTQGSTKVTVVVDVADTPETRARGLKFRRSLPETEGMLFIFDDINFLNFCMCDIIIPLSVAYIDDLGEQFHLHHPQWEIVDIQDMELAQNPHTGPFRGYQSAQPSRWALEVNRGFFQRHNITVGAQVQYTPP